MLRTTKLKPTSKSTLKTKSTHTLKSKPIKQSKPLRTIKTRHIVTSTSSLSQSPQHSTLSNLLHPHGTLSSIHPTTTMNRISLQNSQSTSIHTLKRLSADAQKRFEELSQHLPPPTHPEYSTRRNWISHLLTHKYTVLPDFVAQLGRVVHLIDIRNEEEILSPVGYIRGANWFPKENIDLICNSFPKDGLIAVVCSNDSDSREVVRALKATGHNLAAIVAGGMRSWKLMGFSSSRNPSILKYKNVPVSVQFHLQQQLKILDQNKAGQKQMTLDQVIEHLGSGDNIQWIKLAAFMVHGRLSCIDGRDDSGVIGTPGGDMGEFITHLATVEQLLGYNLTEEQINTLFLRRLDAFGRFYMHSDQPSAQRLVETLSDKIDPRIREVVKELPPDFAIHDILSKIPKEKMYETLEILTMPEHIGCGHLKFMLTDSEKYRVRHDLVKTALKCFFKTRWEAQGTAECDYVILHGQHEECGVANITINREIQSYTKIPLISPSIQNKQVFVNHGQISQYLRHQHSQWFLEQQDVIQFNKTAAAAYPALADLMSEHHASQTVAVLAKDLPMYTLEFSDDHASCIVHYNGIIGSNPEDTPDTNPQPSTNTCDGHIHQFEEHPKLE